MRQIEHLSASRKNRQDAQLRKNRHTQERDSIDCGDLAADFSREKEHVATARCPPAARRTDFDDSEVQEVVEGLADFVE